MKFCSHAFNKRKDLGLNLNSEELKLPEGQISKLFFMPHPSLEAKKLILKNAEIILLEKNSLLFSQQEEAQHFYIVLSGAIKLFKQNPKAATSEQTVLDILGPGEMIGVALMLSASTKLLYPVSAKTLGSTEVLRLSKTHFHEIWTSNPELLDLAHRSIIKRIECMQSDRCIQKFTLEQKVAYFMTEKWFTSSQTRITRKDIADCIGASQEAVIRLLNDWTRKNLVTNHNHDIEVRDIEAIRLLWRSE